MTSSTKPEVHNISRYRQRRTEPWPTLTENFVKLDMWFLRYTSGQIDADHFIQAPFSGINFSLIHNLPIPCFMKIQSDELSCSNK